MDHTAFHNHQAVAMSRALPFLTPSVVRRHHLEFLMLDSLKLPMVEPLNQTHLKLLKENTHHNGLNIGVYKCEMRYQNALWFDTIMQEKCNMHS